MTSTTNATSNNSHALTDLIPRTMSTQHPDNVTTPFFAANPELSGEDEVTRGVLHLFTSWLP